MKNNHNKANFIITLVIIIVFLAVLGTSGYFLYKHFSGQESAAEGNIVDSNAIVSTEKEDLAADFVTETNYIGGIGHPEVYNVPFRKSDFYITNKELWKNSPDNVPVIVSTAQEFANKILNLGYRNINENRSAIQSELTAYLDPYWCYEDSEDEDIPAEEYMDRYLNTIVDNKISMEGRFLTDTSLVYEDGMYVVRGIAEYEVFNSESPDLPASEDKNAVMVEITLTRNDEDPNKYDIIYWYDAEYLKKKIVSNDL